jgi:hypothetical protein
MLARFHAASGFPFGYDRDAMRGLLARMIEADGATVICTAQGVIGGALVPAYCDPQWVQAVELFWWAEDGQGLRLLRAFEEWAREMKAAEVRMTTLSALPRSAKALRGYDPAEVSYRKVI